MNNTENPNKGKIIQLREQGLSYGSIAKMVGLSRARVHQICSGYSPEENRRVNGYILERDSYKCQWGNVCKDKEIKPEDLVIHHIDFDDRNNVSTNLVTLCRYCHSSFHATNHIDKNIFKNLHKKRGIRIKKCKVCDKDFRKYRITCSKKCAKLIIGRSKGLPQDTINLSEGVYRDYVDGMYYKDIAKKYSISGNWVYKMIELKRTGRYNRNKKKKIFTAL